jgi:imidazolonepropionase-like amidohydrolase
MRKLFLLFAAGWLSMSAQAQETFQINGTADKRDGCYAFVHATIVVNAGTSLQNATMVIRDGKIVAVGTTVAIPPDAISIECSGKFIYPSFIDAYSDYGMPATQRQQRGFDFFAPAQLNSNTKGAFGWNAALKSEVQAANLFVVDDGKAKGLREIGFGTVASHQRDGIARGSGLVATLANEKENFVLIKDRATAHYSFNKGSSTQSYPGSMMGMIALLRQTFLDAQWYKSNPTTEGTNLSLKAWNENLALAQVFEANDKWNDLRADRIGDEFAVQFIIKGGGNEYQRITEIAGTKASYILPLNFPQAMDVEDPNDARFVSIGDLKHWELAPTNPAALEKAGINFCLTTADLKDAKQFMANLRKAIQHGLSPKAALQALTTAPANLLGVGNLVGSLEAGKLANFIITNGAVFAEKTAILHNWIQGKKYAINEVAFNDIKGMYNLSVGGNNYQLDVKSSNSANVIGKDTVSAKLNFDGKIVKLSFAENKKSKNTLRLSGISNGDSWSGIAQDSSGKQMVWTASFAKATETKSDSSKAKPLGQMGNLIFPWTGFGWSEAPKQENIIFRNATVWTNEKEGRLAQTDVQIKAGKIVAIGKNLVDATARVVDATGKHLTAGIIDEHSHIAAASINEGGQSVTSEVRIADNLFPDDINIYRQLSGGVTSSHILHGSANTIGGQTQLIKLRWGANDQQLKFEGADPFIKFALGENVKRSSSQNNNRYPDSRMGVEQVLNNAFTRAADYQKALKQPGAVVRKDLELEALSEILNKKRFITCHSYVASEITGMMRIAEKFSFTLNTFTHILEGYKVADKMKAHGANASTFSDWWTYKMEVIDAIPANATIMHKVGLNVAINSDDAEMARRLNQEAAKSVKYGGMSEEDALKMVTLNPAKMLHVDARVGSIKIGKDADLVLWSDNPLSIYAKSLYTIVDGIVYFDREKDAQQQQQQAVERNRLIQKMLSEKKGGADMAPARPSMEIMHSCGEHFHKHGLLVQDADN